MLWEIQVGCYEKLVLCENDQVLEWAAHAGGGITVPGGVQEMFSYFTEGHDLVGNIGDRWMVGLNNVGGLFQPW